MTFPAGNPYAPPPDVSVPASAGASPLTNAMIDTLRRTKPWIVFFLVMQVIGVVFCVLGAIAIALVPSRGQPVPPAALSLFYVLIGIAGAIAAWRIAGYNRTLSDVIYRPDVGTLERSLEANRSMWFVFGVLTIVMIVVSIAGIAVAAIAALPA